MSTATADARPIRLSGRRAESINERNGVVMRNAGFIIQHAKKKGMTGGDCDDERQEAFVGALKAAETWDPEQGTFATFAAHAVSKRITECRYRSRIMVRLPNYQNRRVGRYHRVRIALRQSLGREPTFDEVAERMGLVPAQRGALRDAIDIENRLREPELPRHAISADPEPLDGMIRAEESSLLHEAVACLAETEPKEARAIQLRFGLDDGEFRTFKAIGRAMSISREQARQLVERGRVKLREWLEDAGLTE